MIKLWTCCRPARSVWCIQTRYHSDLAPIRALEAALASDEFSKVARVRMPADYGKQYMADLVIYQFKTEVPLGRVAPKMQFMRLGRVLQVRRKIIGSH